MTIAGIRNTSPMSSAMINKIFGGFVFSIGFEGLFMGDPSELFPVSSLLNPVKVKNAKNQYIWWDFMNSVSYKFDQQKHLKFKAFLSKVSHYQKQHKSND